MISLNQQCKNEFGWVEEASVVIGMDMKSDDSSRTDHLYESIWTWPVGLSTEGNIGSSQLMQGKPELTPLSMFGFPNSGLPEHGHHPDESGPPRWVQAHLPDLRRHPRWKPEGPPRPQELGDQLLVQPGQAAPRTGTPGGKDTNCSTYVLHILLPDTLFRDDFSAPGSSLAGEALLMGHWSYSVTAYDRDIHVSDRAVCWGTLISCTYLFI